jgi:aspartate kinase
LALSVLLWRCPVTEKVKIGGIMSSGGLSMVGVMSTPDRRGVASAILSRLAYRGINVHFIVQCVDLKSRDHLVLCVGRGDLSLALEALDSVRAEVGAEEVISIPEVGIVSVFGPDFRQRPGIAAQTFEALASERVDILAISTSISTVSCVVGEEAVDGAVEALGQVFAMP